MTGGPQVNLVTDVMWPNFQLTDSSVFCRQSFYRLFCKIFNIQDTYIKFLGSIFEVDIDNCAKCREVTIRRSYISGDELRAFLNLADP